MANKKIRLTYFWTDENAILEDFQGKVSADMITWGNKFYARYGFEFDVDPPEADRTSVKRVSKYALVKSKGISPDFRSDEDIQDDKAARITKLKKQLEPAKRQVDVTRQRVKALADEIAAYLNGGTTTDAQNKKYLKDQASASEDLRSARDAYDKEFARIDKAIQAVNDEDHTPLGYEPLFRWQIASRVRASKINMDKRLCVVFCQSEKQGGEGITLGETFGDLKDLLLSPVDRTLLWPFPFIVVNIQGKARGTVAHELVHAAGHKHPDSFVVLDKKVADVKPVAIMKAPQELSVLGDETNPVYVGGVPQSILSPGPDPFYSSEAVRIPGAYFDGDENDIMNYMHPEDPLQCDLADADKKLLESNTTFIGQ